MAGSLEKEVKLMETGDSIRILKRSRSRIINVMGWFGVGFLLATFLNEYTLALICLALEIGLTTALIIQSIRLSKEKRRTNNGSA